MARVTVAMRAVELGFPDEETFLKTRVREGVSAHSIARELGISTGSVYLRVKRVAKLTNAPRWVVFEDAA